MVESYFGRLDLVMEVVHMYSRLRSVGPLGYSLMAGRSCWKAIRLLVEK